MFKLKSKWIKKEAVVMDNSELNLLQPFAEEVKKLFLDYYEYTGCNIVSKFLEDTFERIEGTNDYFYNGFTLTCRDDVMKWLHIRLKDYGITIEIKKVLWSYK